VAWLITVAGWRTAFVVLGLLGFVWVAVWLIFYRDPSKARWLKAPEREKILAERIRFLVCRGFAASRLERETYILLG
jgi:predicted MFS family arabinose efflux permease